VIFGAIKKCDEGGSSCDETCGWGPGNRRAAHPLGPALAGFDDIAQSRWVAWLRKRRFDHPQGRALYRQQIELGLDGDPRAASKAAYF